MSSSSDVEPLDVAIIGGGPGGLAIAVAVLRACPEAKVAVLEVSQKYDVAGSGMKLDINGLRALEAIDPALYRSILDQCIPVTGATMYDFDGSVDWKNEFDNEEDLRLHGKANALTAWVTIRDTLYRFLPEGTVRFGSKVLSYGSPTASDDVQREDRAQAAADLVQLQLADSGSAAAGAATMAPLLAKVVVGADGCFSRVRQQVLNDGPPTFTGRVSWRACVHVKPGDNPGKVRDFPASGRGYNEKGPNGMLRSTMTYPVGQDTFVWTCNAPMETLHEHGLTFDATKPSRTYQEGNRGASAFERCLQLFEDAPLPEFLEMLRYTPMEVVMEHGNYIRDATTIPEVSWGDGRVTLAGDAAHVTPPNGQGLNLAMEDAMILAWHLRDQGFTEEALRAYEAERIPRIKDLLSIDDLEKNPYAKVLVRRNGVVRPLVEEHSTE